jgi:cytochrome c-type biogenesis protein
VTDLVPSVGWLVAFGAGLLSFFSPCTAPLVPGYVSLVTGVSGDELTAGARPALLPALRTSLLFVLGFVVVFVVLGMAAALLGGVVGPARRLVNQVAGALMVAMGLFVLGVPATLRLPGAAALYADRRFHLAERTLRALGPAAPTALGMAFAFGWTPCVGPILAAILFSAGSAGTVGDGAALLLLYALGLGAPFVVAGVALTRMLGVLGWMRRRARLLNWTSGAVLIAMGVLFLTNTFFWVSIAVQRLYYTLAYRA